MSVIELHPWTIFLSIVTALLVGMGKTGIPGLALLAIPLMAFAYPAKESVGMLLLLLIAGDIFAVLYYRKHANIRILFELFPWVAVGIVSGSFALSRLDNQAMRAVLGIVVITMLCIKIILNKVDDSLFSNNRYLTAVIGIFAGFASTIGNAAGPIMGLLLLMKHFHKNQFMGTFGWFFLTLNFAKVPVFLYLGVIQNYAFYYALALLPLVVLGAYLGKIFLATFSQAFFDNLIVGFAGIVAIALIIG